MPDDYNGPPVPENQNPDPGNGDQNDNIPEWMKEAGWETSSGTFDESKPVFDDLDDDEDEIVPADIPAWLEDAAPEGFSSDPNAIPAFEGLDVDEPFITTGDLVPPPSMIDPEPLPEPAQIEDPEVTEEPAKEEGSSEFDIPTWLENLELHEDSQETAIAWLENMPESLRATEEELQAAQDIIMEEPDVIEEPVDELGWVDEVALEPDQSPPDFSEERAELSEDLKASDLLPEAGEEDQIFRQDELQSLDSELPSWLKELGDDQPDPLKSLEPQTPPAAHEVDEPPASQEETIPDWLSEPEDTQTPQAAQPPAPTPEEVAPSYGEEQTDIPDWLGEFETDSAPSAGLEEGPAWLDSLDAEDAAPSEEEAAPAEELPAASTPTIPEFSQPQGVSPNDETLNAQIPDWLSSLGDPETEQVEEQQGIPAEFQDMIEEPPTERDFDTSDSWLDQISEKPVESDSDVLAQQESGVDDWLQDLGDQQADLPPQEEFGLSDLSLDDTSPVLPTAGLETAKYLEPEAEIKKDSPDDLPDWLSELGQDDEQSHTLEQAIRESDRDLNEEEIDFLNRLDEKQEDDADWLSKLDQVETEAEPGAPSPSAISIDPIGDQDQVQTSQDDLQEAIISGGVLDRLKDTAEFKTGEDVPRWLTDLKEEEDPQETAVLWLQQFVNQAGDVDIKDEIKRYTDELDPGVSVPKWMEDLKNEEDPQTTAMLWLEKLSADRQQDAAPEPATKEEEDSGWLADLERESAESQSAPEADKITEFNSTDQEWLSDLDLEEKLKTSDEELPEWSKAEDEPSEPEPPWMKATSPLEGDFYTDELAGGEEKEVEIPDWLAGYAEGEAPPQGQDADGPPEDEYTWLAASEAPGARTPVDLNEAAISQLEAILGISHQIARGIVSYREKHGPYRDFSDLKNVPEIVDEQTIEILKPEVFISEAPPATSPPEAVSEPAPPSKKPVKKSADKMNMEEVLVTARTRIKDRQISEASQQYGLLIKKKKFLDEIIDDLKQAVLDFPLEIAIHQTLGDAFMAKDMLDQALEAYSRAEDLLS